MCSIQIEQAISQQENSWLLFREIVQSAIKKNLLFFIHFCLLAQTREISSIRCAQQLLPAFIGRLIARRSASFGASSSLSARSWRMCFEDSVLARHIANLERPSVPGE